MKDTFSFPKHSTERSRHLNSLIGVRIGEDKTGDIVCHQTLKLSLVFLYHRLLENNSHESVKTVRDFPSMTM